MEAAELFGIMLLLYYRQDQPNSLDALITQTFGMFFSRRAYRFKFTVYQHWTFAACAGSNRS